MRTAPRPLMLVVVLVWAMVAGTIAFPALAVLASTLIDDLGLSPFSYGLLVFSFAAASAVASPPGGRVADRLGARRATLATFALSAIGFLAMSASAGLGGLIASTFVVAAGQAFMNPATNLLIAAHIAEGRRGVVTGVKQSGVYVGYVLAGALAPTVAATAGWRSFLVGVAVVSAAGIAAAAFSLPPDAHGRARRGGPTPRVPGWIGVLASYGFLMGTAASSGAFLPLYAESELGFSSILAGALTSFLGVAAIMTRILGAHAAERNRRYRTALSFTAGSGVLFGGLVLLAPTLPWLIWLAAVSFALGLSAWNAIGMLAVIDLAGARLAGAATGRVQLGFLSGLAVGPLLFGWAIDEVGYPPVWAGVAVLTVGALLVARAWRPLPTP